MCIKKKLKTKKGSKKRDEASKRCNKGERRKVKKNKTEGGGPIMN